jgi:drug/metabolite transporter (DMT)-like permease
VSRRHVIMLLALGAIWGASFLLIEIGLRDLEPSTLILLRLGFGALALGAFIPFSGASFRELRPYAGALALIGLLNTALPFFLIAWGQQYIDSGLAAIFNASAPLFTALLALSLDRTQRVTGLRLVGLLVGFVGIVALVGFEPGGGERAVAGSLAVIAASVCYALGALYVGRRFTGLSPVLVSFGGLAWATIFALPLGAAQASAFGWEALAAMLALGIGATAVAYLLYFGLIAGAGASRAILVTYLVPPLALLYGATLLDEPVTLLALVGLGLVLTGVALGTRGGSRAPRPETPAPAPPADTTVT